MSGFTGRAHTPETRDKISAAKMGHEVSPETRAKIGKSRSAAYWALSEEEREANRARRRKPGARPKGDPTYVSWTAMKQRCLNPNLPAYPYHGGAGHTVCDSWMKFSGFLADMGERPGREWTLKLVSGTVYGPGSCEWVLKKAYC